MLGFEALGRNALGQVTAATARSITIEAGSFSVIGQAATLSNARTIAAAAGTFTLTGKDAALPIRMPADVGAFTFTGNAAGVVTVRRLTASPYPIRNRQMFGFAALGEVALGQGSEVDGVTFQISGKDTGFSINMPAEVGTFTLTGQDARIVKGLVMEALHGTYAVSGQSVTLRLNMPADVGTFTTGGNVIEFIRRRPRIRAFPRVGNPTFSGRTLGRGFKARAYG